MQSVPRETFMEVAEQSKVFHVKHFSKASVPRETLHTTSPSRWHDFPAKTIRPPEKCST